MARRDVKRAPARADEPLVVRRTLVILAAGLVLGVSLYAGLVEVGLVRSPFAPVAGGELGLARSDRPGLRVLFVGNSFTYANDLPELVYRLAGSAHPIFAASYTAPGWRLQKAARDHGLEALLHEVRWDVVVLQEQSQIPSFARNDRAQSLDPYAHELNEKIRAAGARTLLFMTWGYRDGDRRNVPRDTYAAMQQRLVQGYSDVALQLGAQIAPVGLAWADARRRQPHLDLWAGDGKHPSRLGSYLAACVFYATFTHRDPSARSYMAGLKDSDARLLQRVAWNVERFRS